MITDPFSDVLSLIRPITTVSGGFTAGGSWGLRFSAPNKIKFFSLLKGECWLHLDGNPEPIRVKTGDILLLSAQRTFILASDLAAKVVDAESLFSGDLNKFATLGDGEDCIQIGGHVLLDLESGAFLTSELPPLIHVHSESQQAAILRWLLEQIVSERRMNRPGAIMVSAQLAQLVFVQILRAYFESSGPINAGWLSAISDARLAPALRLIHGDPGRSWQLKELADAAAMSRTTFLLRFKNAAGVTPLTYLTEWRMQLARRRLREQDTPVHVLARQLGYASESAFSSAFKRVAGQAPKHYRTYRPIE